MIDSFSTDTKQIPYKDSDDSEYDWGLPDSSNTGGNVEPFNSRNSPSSEAEDDYSSSYSDDAELDM